MNRYDPTLGHRPFVVAFEGPDGVGKTTLLAAVMESLRALDYPVISKALPSSSVVPWSPLLSKASAGDLSQPPGPPTPTQCLRHALAQGAQAPLLLLLDCARAVVADRRRTRPGMIALHDRSSLSTAVYQGPAEACFDLTGEARPDLVILLTAPVDVLAARRRARGDEVNAAVSAAAYVSAAMVARRRGWIVSELCTGATSVDQCVERVLHLISLVRDGAGCATLPG